MENCPKHVCVPTGKENFEHIQNTFHTGYKLFFGSQVFKQTWSTSATYLIWWTSAFPTWMPSAMFKHKVSSWNIFHTGQRMFFSSQRFEQILNRFHTVWRLFFVSQRFKQVWKTFHTGWRLFFVSPKFEQFWNTSQTCWRLFFGFSKILTHLKHFFNLSYLKKLSFTNLGVMFQCLNLKHINTLTN